MKPYYLTQTETQEFKSGDPVKRAMLQVAVLEHVQNDGSYAFELMEVRTQDHSIAFKVDNGESEADQQSRFYAAKVAVTHAIKQADDMGKIVEDVKDMCILAEHYLDAVRMIYGAGEIDEEWVGDFMAHFNGNVGTTTDF